ncbi:hypothetical protein [Burkholderia ubonensis]|uniref:hypothetical protein n=1 Tax=Burkholderia ubonensis TaxID=101571 RepID=UPI0007544C8C|nr:hypothetical protein [Burkholderia ubonensis]KVN50068.1 hypothetical protein WJ64_20395 [Burkholderia ubonensis]
MNFHIIDVSKQTVSEFSSEFSKPKALGLVAWYRFARPAIVLMIWVLAASYIRWCVANADKNELSLDAFMPSIVGMTMIAIAMVAWTIARSLVVRQAQHAPRDVDHADHIALLTTASRVPDAGRCLVAYHDDAGNISHVEAVADATKYAA